MNKIVNNSLNNISKYKSHYAYFRRKNYINNSLYKESHLHHLFGLNTLSNHLTVIKLTNWSIYFDSRKRPFK